MAPPRLRPPCHPPLPRAPLETPPVLGFFRHTKGALEFTPVGRPPDCVPAERFSLRLDGRGGYYWCLGCRGDRVVLLSRDLLPYQVMVWDPVTGERRSISIPPGICNNWATNGALFFPAGDDHGHSRPFQVVLVVVVNTRQVFACIYSPDTGEWSNLITTGCQLFLTPAICSILVGGSLYWLLLGDGKKGILQLHMDTQRLATIDLPPDALSTDIHHVRIMPAESGGLGLLRSGYSAQLWKMKPDCDGVAEWVLGKTIELDKIYFP